MCYPFHEKEGDWYRFSSTWVFAKKAKATVDNVHDFVKERQENLSFLGGYVLFVSGSMVEGEEHLLACAMHALRRRDRGGMKTRSIVLEALLFVAGQPHVNKAIEQAGIKEGDEEVWILVFLPAGSEKPSVSDMEATFGITFIEAPWYTERTPIALERAALLGL